MMARARAAPGISSSSPLTSAPSSDKGEHSSRRSLLKNTTSSSSLTPPPSSPSSKLPTPTQNLVNVTPTKRRQGQSGPFPSRTPSPSPSGSPSASPTPRAKKQRMELSQTSSGLSSCPATPRKAVVTPKKAINSDVVERRTDMDEMLGAEGAVVLPVGLGREISRWRGDTASTSIGSMTGLGRTDSESSMVPSSDPAEQMQPLFSAGSMAAAVAARAIEGTVSQKGKEREKEKEVDVEMEIDFEGFEWDEEEPELMMAVVAEKVDMDIDGEIGAATSTAVSSPVKEGDAGQPTMSDTAGLESEPDDAAQSLSKTSASSPTLAAPTAEADKKTTTLLEQIRARAEAIAREEEEQRKRSSASLSEEEESESDEEVEIMPLDLDKQPTKQRVLRSATVESRMSEDIQPVITVKKDPLPAALMQLKNEYKRLGKFGRAGVEAAERKRESMRKEKEMESLPVYEYSSSEAQDESDDEEEGSDEEDMGQGEPAVEQAERWGGITASLKRVPSMTHAFQDGDVATELIKRLKEEVPEFAGGQIRKVLRRTRPDGLQIDEKTLPLVLQLAISSDQTRRAEIPQPRIVWQAAAKPDNKSTSTLLLSALPYIASTSRSESEAQYRYSLWLDIVEMQQRLNVDLVYWLLLLAVDNASLCADRVRAMLCSRLGHLSSSERLRLITDLVQVAPEPGCKLQASVLQILHSPAQACQIVASWFAVRCLQPDLILNEADLLTRPSVTYLLDNIANISLLDQAQHRRFPIRRVRRAIALLSVLYLDVPWYWENNKTSASDIVAWEEKTMGLLSDLSKRVRKRGIDTFEKRKPILDAIERLQISITDVNKEYLKQLNAKASRANSAFAFIPGTTQTKLSFGGSQPPATALDVVNAVPDKPSPSPFSSAPTQPTNATKPSSQTPTAPTAKRPPPKRRIQPPAPAA